MKYLTESEVAACNVRRNLQPALFSLSAAVWYIASLPVGDNVPIRPGSLS